MVSSPHELEHWVKLGKAKAPNSYEVLTGLDTVFLPPGQSLDCLFKIQTFREVVRGNTKSSSDFVASRDIKISFS